jgi:iron complex outermembrane receptor protein
MKQAVMIMACCLVGFPVWGQYRLSGTIRNTRGENLVGAAIVIQNSYLGTSSGADGGYVLEGIHGGKNTILVSYLGYKPQKKEIDAVADIRVDFVLEPSSILGDEVVVKATRMSGGESAANTILGRSKIEEQNTGRDIPFLLVLTPSLVATSDAGTGIGYTNLRIRGTDSYRINVTVNGIPLNDAESHGVWWVNMPDFASSVENIQVQRGVGASTNGAAAFGGTISMQTSTYREKPYAVASINAGSFNTMRRNVMLGSGLIKNRFSLDARLSKLDSDGYIDRAFSHLKSWYISGASYGRGSILRFNIFSGDEKTYQAWWGIDKAILDTNRRYNPYTYKNETDNYTQTHYQLLYSKALNENLYLNTALHYTLGKGYYENFKEDAVLAEFNLDSAGGNASSNLVTRKWMDNDFYGVTYSLHYRKQQMEVLVGGGWNEYTGNHFGRVIKLGDDPVSHEYYRNKGDKSDLNNYLKFSYRIQDRLTLYADLQYRHINYSIEGVDDYRDTSGVQVPLEQLHTFDFVNPKTGVFFKLNNRQDFYLTFSTGRREPTRANYVDATLQTEKPRPETLYDLEGGSNFKADKFKANLNVFYMYYVDQLVHTGKLNDVAYPIMVNVPKSYRLGVEIMTSFQPIEIVRWDGNLTLSRNKIHDFVEYSDYYDADFVYLGHLPRSLGTTDISYSPGITGSSSVSVKPIASLEFSLVSRYVGRQYFDNTSSRDRMLDPYFINDLNVNWTIHPGIIKSLILQLQVNNLFNAEYESNAYGGNWYENNIGKSWSCWFPQAGINFMGGLKIEF